ncbi:hypothetical protein Sjap_024393 [Stephania japonica]|uniref:Cytochrome P450 n=1 Tax=Stephania japonica TaxID=461633 RepID=A0AAP0HNX5_9MAGN
MNARRKMVDELLETIIEEHMENANKQQERYDFVDVMLSLMESDYMQHVKFDHGHIKSILIDVLAAGMDTSANVLNLAFPELLRHPKVMYKVQQELKQEVGMDRMVEEMDLPKLSYLNIVIKEILRLHYPVAPLLIPHESTEDIVINEYYIPKKSRVLVNVWALGRDPNVWSEDAEEFNPDRFINLDIDIHGRDFQLIPFGSGRRGCPGMQLGLVMVKYILAQLLHCFNWEVPDGVSPSDLDMTKKLEAKRDDVRDEERRRHGGKVSEIGGEGFSEKSRVEKEEASWTCGDEVNEKEGEGFNTKSRGGEGGGARRAHEAKETLHKREGTKDEAKR